jgi:hypothetical protein
MLIARIVVSELVRDMKAVEDARRVGLHREGAE